MTLTASGRRAFGLLIGLLLAGCVSVGKTVLDTSFQANPVPRDDVYVYMPGDTVPEHTRVAILDAEGDADLFNNADLLNKLREEAGKLGANAIIIGELEDPSTGARVAKAILGTTANRTGQAVAIFVPSRSRTRQQEGDRRP
ncbi:MAG: hypothetical protein JSU98_01725 [Gemmatimonadales bacterium]|jgi:hypothetical protein|nr:MAG: hypothetical protein JSU98_01725 [Gemmatimonadales bacterium]